MLKFASLSIANKTKKLLAILVATIIAFSTFVGILPLNLIAGALPDSSDFKSTEVYATDFSSDDASTWKMANANNNIESGKLSLTAAGTDVYSSVAMRTEERNEQYIRATFNTSDFTNARPVIWARATYLEESNPESIVGYYLVFKKNNDIQLWKRSLVGSNYEDSFIAYCGAVNWDNNKQYQYVLEMNITGTDCAVINVRIFKATTYLQGRQTVVDNTNPHLQGGAGVSVCGTAANAIGKFSAFDYYSTDNFNKYYYAYENGVKTGVSFAQTIALNKDTEYTLSVEVEDAADYEPLVISYATTNASTGAHILIDLDDCVLTENNGKKVYSYKFKLSDQSTAPLNYYDQRFANSDYRTTPVFVGFRQSNASIKNRYTKFQVCENLSNGTLGPNLLVNGDFKLGLYGWSDHLDTAFGSSYSYGAVGDTASKNSSRVKLDGPFVDIDMNNVYYKLTQSKELNITFVGGSVTSGHGASDTEATSWRALTTQWFKDNYPDATISAKNAAVGSTGSHFALYNYGLVTEHETDLLFVDAAINDFYLYSNARNGSDNPESSDAYDYTFRNLESLIRNARAKNPNIEIVFILTFDHWRLTDATNPSIKAMIDLANRYLLPCIDLRVPLKEKATEDGFAWNDVGLRPYRYRNDPATGTPYAEDKRLYSEGDGVHPNDAGYRLFADYVIGILEDYMDNAQRVAPTSLKDKSITNTPISDSIVDTPTIITANNIPLSSGWTLQSGSFSSISDKFGTTYTSGKVVTTTPDSTLSYTFTGTDFGIITMIGSEYGKIYVEVDGVPYRQGVNGNYPDGVIDLNSSGSDHRTQIIATGLTNAEHTVTIKSLAGTGGNRVEIGAYYVNAEIPQYTVTETSGSSTDVLPTTENLIYGKRVTASSLANAFAHLTDGVNAGKGADGSGWPYKLTYALDKKYKLSELQIISGTAQNRLGAFEIYISEDENDLYNANNLVATHTGNSVAWVTDATTVDTVKFNSDYAVGSYLGIKLTKRNPDTVTGPSYIHEVIVKGTEEAVPEPDYTLTTELKGANDYTLDTTNLIYGINPIEGASVPRFTDGNKQCLPAGMTQLSFPLVESVKINEIRIISQNGYAGKASRLAAYDIYIADTKDDLYKEENKVTTFNTDSTATDYVAAIDTFEFSSTYDTKGKYVGFKVTKTDNSNMNKVHIIELEVYGTGGGSVNPGDDAEFAPRPVLENINNNFEFNSGEVSVQGGRGSIDNLYISQEAHTNQYVQLDYTYNKAIIPYVWAKAICSTTNNKSVTGYYACIENGTSVKLYKRTYDAANNTMVDTEIGPCGNATFERIVRLEIVTEKAGNATKITVTAYKTGSSDGRFKLMTKNTYFDSTPELQTPGYAGYSVKGFGSTADVKNFSFCSSDGTTATLSYLENPVTKNAGGIAGQKVIINPTKTYTLTARVSAVNTQLALYYLNADGKLEQGFKAVGNVSNVDGYRTVTFTFCLNDLIAQESLVAPKNDKYAYGDGLAQVFVGFVTDKAKVISYSNLSLVEKDTGNQMLINQDFTMGIYGWAEAITNFWAFETGNYGETSTTQYGRLNLKTNVSQADYDKIFKMASGEQGDIDLSKYDKLMVHITGDGVEYTKLGQILYLEPNTKYVYEVDFGFQPRKSARPLIFFHTVEDTKITYSTTKCIEPTYKLYKEGSRTKYVFSVPEEAYVNSETGKVTAFIGLSSGETGANCYFANFTVYKESDSNKTNLFKNADFKEGFKYWNINANYQWSQLSAISVLTYKQPGSGIELLPYDASKIKLDDETLTVPDIPDFEYDNYKGEYMVYIPETVTSTYGKLGQIHYLEKGVTYNFSMLYKYIRQNSTKQVIFYFTDDPHASNDYIISKGYTNAKGEVDKSKYIAAIRKTATFDMTMDETNSRISIDFKVPSEAWKNSEGKAPMFVGISTGELGTKCYFAKLTLTKEGSKENIFTNADFKKGFLDWSIGYGYLMEPVTQNGVFFTAGYTVAQLLPFDDTIFVNDTNDNLWNDGEWFSIFGADDKIASNDSSVENASTEYKTVTVKGKLNVPATIALYSGIAVVLVGGSFGTVFAIKKKKIK